MDFNRDELCGSGDSDSLFGNQIEAEISKNYYVAQMDWLSDELDDSEEALLVSAIDFFRVVNRNFLETLLSPIYKEEMLYTLENIDIFCNGLPKNSKYEEQYYRSTSIACRAYMDIHRLYTPELFHPIA